MDSISCSICLDILKDPVTIACGHSYCMVCIKGSWDHDNPTGIYNCPQCRQTFSPRPVFKNTLPAELVQKIEKTRLQLASYVECDACTGTKPKAVKSCLVCMSSYCDTHLQLHNELNPGNKHTVIDATEKLKEKLCPHHNKLLEVYCRTDQQCICFLCTIDDHKAHDVVSIESERKEKQEQLQNSKTQCHQRIHQREREIRLLRKNVDSLKRSAQEAEDVSELIFSELIRLIEARCTEVKELIRAREKAEVNRVEALLEQLKQEVSELMRADAEMEQLFLTEDHLHFLRMFQPQPLPPESGTSATFHTNPLLSFKDLMTFASKLNEQLQDTCTEEMAKINQKVVEVGIQLSHERVSRQGFLKYFCPLTLDPNTSHNMLCLSEGDSKVTWRDEAQQYPDHPDRFTEYYQVLCKEALSGTCYWEVKWSGERVEVAMTYKEISRQRSGNGGDFGRNEKSWTLNCCPSASALWHDNRKIPLPPSHSSRIVGVYLDHGLGILAFYDVSNRMTLLYRVRTKFSQPLYPGFYVPPGSCVKILTPLQ